MNLKALRQREHDLKADARAILDRAEKEGRGALSVEEESRFAAIELELTELAGQIAAAEQLAERRRAMQPTGAIAGGATQPYGQVRVGDDRATLDPRCGFASMAEFGRAVMRGSSGAPNFAIDTRLNSMQAADPTNFHREGGSRDGYMVPPEFRDQIWELVHAEDNFLADIDSEPTNSNVINDMIDESTPWGAAGIKARWRNEATLMTATRQNLKPRSVMLHELFCFVSATDELIEDAPRLESRLTSKSAEAISWLLDDTIMYGDGVGKPIGYFNSPALVSVAKEAAQQADTIVALNVVKMYARMLSQGIARTAWLVNSDVVPQLMTMTLGQQPIWTPPATGFQNAPGGILLGRPVRFSEHCRTLGDKGDIQFVDLKGYYGARKEGGTRYATSMHLYFDYGMTAFRWILRFGGQPHLSAPVVPANGANTKSHFITLDERA
jgi:HK97 family phage major capsid protein